MENSIENIQRDLY